MLYITAVVLAGIIIAGGAWFVRHTERAMRRKAVAAVERGQASSCFPPEASAKQIDLRECGIALPQSMLRRLGIARAMVAWRFVLMLAVLFIALGIAALIDQFR